MLEVRQVGGDLDGDMPVMEGEKAPITSRTLTGLSEYRVRRVVCEAWSLVLLDGEGGRVVACALQMRNKTNSASE